jgi:hypothetical protein
MGELRKITAFIPVELMDRAQSLSGEGITETLKQALERYAVSEWSRRMLALQGKVDFSDFDLDALREDREFDAAGNVV